MQGYIILLICLCCCLLSSSVLGGGAFYGYQQYGDLSKWWESLTTSVTDALDPTKAIGLRCPTCQPDEYCNITTGNKCAKKKRPGEMCTVGTSSECIGDSKCYVTASGSRCSAGKDGRNPPSASNPGHYTALGSNGCSAVIPCPPGYYCKLGTEPCKPAQNPGATCLAGQHGQCKGDSKCIVSSWGGARCSAGIDGRNPPSASNPGHYSALGTQGCSAVIPCPPGYYCKIGTEPCKPAQNPGASCLAGQHQQCKGDSKCFLSASGGRCSAGKDGRNPPSSSNPGHYTALGAKGCSAVIPCPPGYYCKVGWEECKKANPPGSSCLAGQHQQCRGDSKCFLSARGGICSAGKDGKNAPGEAGNPRDQHYMPLGQKGCSAAINCPPGYWCKAAGTPCAKGSPTTGQRIGAALNPLNWF